LSSKRMNRQPDASRDVSLCRVPVGAEKLSKPPVI
jgi:hypothetical protein